MLIREVTSTIKSQNKFTEYVTLSNIRGFRVATTEKLTTKLIIISISICILKWNGAQNQWDQY